MTALPAAPGLTYAQRRATVLAALEATITGGRGDDSEPCDGPADPWIPSPRDSDVAANTADNIRWRSLP